MHLAWLTRRMTGPQFIERAGRKGMKEAREEAGSGRWDRHTETGRHA